MAFKMTNPFKQKKKGGGALVAMRIKKCPTCGKRFTIHDGGALSPHLSSDGGYAEHVASHKTEPK